MPNLNKLDIIGNVGSEPELRFTPSGRPVCNFSVAVNNSYKRENETIQETDWFAIVVWGKLAEISNQFISKGESVYITGRVTLNRWENKDGSKNSKMELTASRIIFLSKKGDTSQPESQPLEPEDIPF